jgi:hypothetical protein
MFWETLVDPIGKSPKGESSILLKFIDLKTILSPLSLITTRAALADLLSARAPRFRQLKTGLEELLWTSVALKDSKEQPNGLFRGVRKLTLAKSDLLGAEAQEQLLGAVDSAEAFNNWMINTSEEGPRGIHRLTALTQQVGAPALYAEMCIAILMLVLADHVTDWLPEAIPVLAGAADDFMSEVEDAFLSDLPADRSAEETVGYETLRQRLGL